MGTLSKKEYLSLKMPTEELSVSDQKRIELALHTLGYEHVTFPLKVLRKLYPLCRDAGFDPKIVCRSASPSTTFSMVQGGLGVALLPSEEFHSHNLEGVAEVALKETICKEVGVAWRTDSCSPLIRAAVAGEDISAYAAEVSEVSDALKAELEKIREQTQNIE